MLIHTYMYNVHAIHLDFMSSFVDTTLVLVLVVALT